MHVEGNFHSFSLTLFHGKLHFFSFFPLIHCRVRTEHRETTKKNLNWGSFACLTLRKLLFDSISILFFKSTSHCSTRCMNSTESEFYLQKPDSNSKKTTFFSYTDFNHRSLLFFVVCIVVSREMAKSRVSRGGNVEMKSKLWVFLFTYISWASDEPKLILNKFLFLLFCCSSHHSSHFFSTRLFFCERMKKRKLFR